MPIRRRFAKMVGGAITGSCPPGVFCLDTGTVLMSILVLIAVVAIAVFVAQQYGLLPARFSPSLTEKAPSVVVVNRTSPPPVTLNADPRFAPLSPERSYAVPPDLRGQPPLPAGLGALPVNTLTRGLPDAFQQIGVLTTAGGTETSATPTRTILPLFGRAVDSARNRWNYYTRTDGINPVQVPVQFKRRNCDDDTGCEEISEGDSVGVPIMGQAFTASVYRYSIPRYLSV